MRIVASVSQVEVDIVIIIFVLLATLHLGIVVANCFIGLAVVVVFLLLGDGRFFLGSDRLFLLCVGRGRGSGRRRLGRCVVVVAWDCQLMRFSVSGSIATANVGRKTNRSSKRSSSKFSGSDMVAACLLSAATADKLCREASIEDRRDAKGAN